MSTAKSSTEPETIPVESGKGGKKPSRNRGADPIEPIPYREVRGHMLIERAFDGLDEGECRRLAGLVADKYGPKPPTIIPGLRVTGIGVAGDALPTE